jgi:hypothetical protein
MLLKTYKNKNHFAGEGFFARLLNQLARLQHSIAIFGLAERGPMLRTAETNPLYQIKYLYKKIKCKIIKLSQLQVQVTFPK